MALDILAIAWGVGNRGWERLTYTPRQILKKEEKKKVKKEMRFLIFLGYNI